MSPLGLITISAGSSRRSDVVPSPTVLVVTTSLPGDLQYPRFVSVPRAALPDSIKGRVRRAPHRLHSLQVNEVINLGYDYSPRSCFSIPPERCLLRLLTMLYGWRYCGRSGWSHEDGDFNRYFASYLEAWENPLSPGGYTEDILRTWRVLPEPRNLRPDYNYQGRNIVRLDYTRETAPPEPELVYRLVVHWGWGSVSPRKMRRLAP